MPRYIDADALLQEINDFPYGYRGMIKDVVAKMPTADVVEVVRCKDCKWWEYDTIFEDGWCRGKRQGNPKWFCADGERKDGGADEETR